MDGGIVLDSKKNPSVLCLYYIKKNVKQTNVLFWFTKQTNKRRKKKHKKPPSTTKIPTTPNYPKDPLFHIAVLFHFNSTPLRK